MMFIKFKSFPINVDQFENDFCNAKLNWFLTWFTASAALKMFARFSVCTKSEQFRFRRFELHIWTASLLASIVKRCCKHIDYIVSQSFGQRFFLFFLACFRWVEQQSIKGSTIKTKKRIYLLTGSWLYSGLLNMGILGDKMVKHLIYTTHELPESI